MEHSGSWTPSPRVVIGGVAGEGEEHQPDCFQDAVDAGAGEELKMGGAWRQTTTRPSNSLVSAALVAGANMENTSAPIIEPSLITTASLGTQPAS